MKKTLVAALLATVAMTGAAEARNLYFGDGSGTVRLPDNYPTERATELCGAMFQMAAFRNKDGNHTYYADKVNAMLKAQLVSMGGMQFMLDQIRDRILEGSKTMDEIYSKIDECDSKHQVEMPVQEPAAEVDEKSTPAYCAASFLVAHEGYAEAGYTDSADFFESKLIAVADGHNVSDDEIVATKQVVLQFIKANGSKEFEVQVLDGCVETF